MKRIRRGFTLIELMVVIIILAILAAMIAPKVMGRQGEAKVAAAKSNLKTLSDSLRLFRLDNDRYPTTEEGLNALRTSPSDVKNWKGPYLEKDVPADPWGNPYDYESPGNNGTDSFILRSLGADGQQGGDGEAADIYEGDL